MSSMRTRPIVTVVLIALVTVPLTVRAEETTSAESAFQRAEILFRQLGSIDATCADDESWAALADVYARIPERFPTDPLAGDALWRQGWIDACRDRAGAPEAAVGAERAFRLLIERYPGNRYAPDAHLQLAAILEPAEAQTLYYHLLRRYPGSPQARTARQRLQTGGGGGHGDSDATSGIRATSVTDDSGEATRPDDAEASPPETADEKSAAPEAPETPPTPVSGSSAPATGPGDGDEGESVGDPVGAESGSDVTGEEGDAAVSEPAEVAADAGRLGRLLGVRHYSDSTHTRVVFDLDRPIHHEIGEAKDPFRVFVDLLGAELPPGLRDQASVFGPGVAGLRMGVNRPGVVRVVLDLEAEVPYTFFTLQDPDRLVIDLPSPEMSERLANARRPKPPEGGAEARQLSLGVRRVVIDPGHGGTAPGAIGRSGITEKELTLDIGRRLADNLRRSGYDVLLTREEDRSLPLEDRPRMATEAGADLFVSIHVNSSTNRKLSGFETYYLDLATEPSAAETAARENAMASTGVGELEHVLDEIVKNANKRESRDLAHSIQDSLVLQTSKVHDDVRDLGVKHAPFIVLVGAEMPAVLVECSFVSHPDEEERLRDPAYRQQVADAILIGIENYSAKRRMITASH